MQIFTCNQKHQKLCTFYSTFDNLEIFVVQQQHFVLSLKKNIRKKKEKKIEIFDFLEKI